MVEDKDKLAWVTGGVSGLLFVVLSSCVLFDFFTLDDGIRKFDLAGIKQEAVSLLFDHLKTLGMFSVGTLALLWSAWLLDGKFVLSTRAQQFSFVVSNLFVISSILVYAFGYWKMVAVLFFHGTIDFDAPITKWWIWSQILYFLLGIASVGSTLYVCRDRK